MLEVASATSSIKGHFCVFHRVWNVDVNILRNGKEPQPHNVTINDTIKIVLTRMSYPKISSKRLTSI